MTIVLINPYLLKPLEIEGSTISANANVIFNSITGRIELSNYE
jgi:hypothetical protein